MDALQQPHRFPPPPPPPSMSDPQQPPRPPQAASWYPNQFHYQPPPPQQHPSWPPPSDHHPSSSSSSSSSSSYLTPYQHNSAPPYPTHPQHHPFPPPPPQHQHHHNHNQQHMPPPPYSSHPSQSYSQPNTHQTWGNPNWAHHQDGINPNNHEEDWAARARAWAAANAAMENQPQPSQFPHLARPEEQNHAYRDQYQRAVDPHYTDIQQPSFPASNHQQFSVNLGNTQRLPANHLHEPSSFSSGPSSCYVSDEHVSYTTKDGALAADPNPGYPYQGINVTNSSVFQQEVPSSYSSAPGKEEVRDRNVHFHTRLPSPMSSAQEGQHYAQSRLSDTGRPVSAERRHLTYGDWSAEPIADPSDKPLEFAPGFYREYDSHNQHSQASYPNPDPAGSMEAIASVPTVSTLSPPVVPGMVYPPMPPVPSGLQFEPSFGAPPIPGHSIPIFGQIPGPNFRPPMPTASAPFGLGMGNALHPGAAFPGEPNGYSNVSERPKKASVPNWLREEIIKKKSVIPSSSQEHSEQYPDYPTEDYGVEMPFVKSGLAGKNLDSSRLSDDEDDDEDDIEAARTAAVNQEIKRVLTEVLLKVTDELFDEIATKVLSEDDLPVEVDRSVAPPKQKTSPSPPAAPTTKASAKVLIPVKSKETEAGDASEKSSSGLPGDVLGLASYASDDDEDESSSKPSMRQMHAAHPQPSNKLSEAIPKAVENGGSQAEARGPTRVNYNDQKKGSSSEALKKPTVSHGGLSGDESDEVLNHKNSRENIGGWDAKVKVDEGKALGVAEDFKPKDVGGKPALKPELQQGNVSGKKSTKEKYAERETKRRSVDQDNVKQADIGKVKSDDKHSGSIESGRDERRVRQENMDDRVGSKDKVKDRGSKPGEKARESESRRSSSSKDDKVEPEKTKRVGDSSRKRDRERDEKEDRSRHRSERDSSRHKRRHSPSVGKRVRNSKDNSVSSPVNESSDEVSEDSMKRKPHSTRKRSLSPSFTKSRRRQVSRSPHSKHSQRRHSPYSSLETTRRRRSKSKSPVRRRR